MGYTYKTDECDFSLSDTLCCGQCFTFRESLGGFVVCSGGRTVFVEQRGDELFFDCCENEFFEYWRGFFGLDADYASLKKRFCADSTMAEAVAYASGIRVLRQELWETLCCFIISQNNNIKRITGIVARLCEGFGESCGAAFSFPRPQTLAPLSPDDLSELRCGFRARYIIDAARVFPTLDKSVIINAPLADAAAELKKIKGVGDKVAACTLLYGAGRTDAFPRDVWINRVMQSLYPDGLPRCVAGYEGIAQQYLFHYARTCLKL